MCKSSARKGAMCPFGVRCQFLHTESISDIPKAAQKALVTHVDNQPTLRFCNAAVERDPKELIWTP